MDTKPCPFCKDKISALATRCQHCGRAFTAVAQTRRVAAAFRWITATIGAVGGALVMMLVVGIGYAISDLLGLGIFGDGPHPLEQPMRWAVLIGAAAGAALGWRAK